MRSLLLTASALLLLGCGGSDSDEAESDAPTSTALPTTSPPLDVVSGAVTVTIDDLQWLLLALDSRNNPEALGDYLDLGADPATAPPCPGLPSGFDDIRDGTAVTVKGADGTTILANPRLTDGLFFKDGPTRGCRFSFTAELPPDAFYTFAIPGRGEQTYSAEDLESAGWLVDLSIG